MDFYFNNCVDDEELKIKLVDKEIFIGQYQKGWRQLTAMRKLRKKVTINLLANILLLSQWLFIILILQQKRNEDHVCRLFTPHDGRNKVRMAIEPVGLSWPVPSRPAHNENKTRQVRKITICHRTGSIHSVICPTTRPVNRPVTRPA